MPIPSMRAALLPDLSVPPLRRVRAVPSLRQLAGAESLLLVLPAAAGAAQPGRRARPPELPETLPFREALSRALARERPAAGQCITLTLPNAAQTCAVIGALAGDAEPFDALQLAGAMAKAAGHRLAGRVVLHAALAGDAGRVASEALVAAALARDFALPRFGRSPPRRRLLRIDLHDGGAIDLAQARAAAAGNNLARWLTALPPNLLDATAYRRLLAQFSRRHGLRLRWWNEAALRRAGAGAFLAVAAGNAARDAGIAQLSYRPRTRRARRPGPDVALVGKGVLFDTGGTNLKPHKSMLDMHTDMAGSAVALASTLALAELRVPFAIDCWLAITENRIGPTAYRPQDVVRAANGLTIQVIHTDAEGRMALADTLALAGRTRPRTIIDFATLTGACVHALTERMSGAFTNRPALHAAIEEAGRRSGERVHCFPMPHDYDADLESRVADVLQCAVDGKGDHILAARFLRRFVPEESTWLHVDLAAATRTGGLGHVTTDVTGFGVRFALEALRGATLRPGEPQ
jgi:leucyl aminopeptidase